MLVVVIGAGALDLAYAAPLLPAWERMWQDALRREQGAASARVRGAHLVTEVVGHPIPEPQRVYPRCGPEQLKLPESSYPDAKLLRRRKYLCGI